MEELGSIAAIWRYPVKSLAAQALSSVGVDRDGLAGDRTAALIVRSENARKGKTFRGKENRLLHTTHDPQHAVAFAAQAGVTAELTAAERTRYYDDAPVSLVFDRWIAQVERALRMPLDPRRWRPNLYARAAPDFNCEEAALLGCTIEAGGVLLRVRDEIRRCVTTTYDIAGGKEEPRVLSHVANERANVMGVYCEVELAGIVRVGDVLRLRAR